MSIHPTAIVDATAVLAATVEVGPYAIIGAHVSIGAGTTVGAHAIVEGPATIGEGNRIYPHAALGGPPQDLKYKGEPTELHVGSRNVFREFMTAHRGTMGGHRKTVIGDDNFFMAYAHVAHDCVIGNRTVFANGASLAGHCTVEDDVILGGYVVVKQFLTIGRHAYVGGFTPVNRNVLPFVWTSSDRETKAWKVNAVGLSRKGFSPESVAALQKAYRVLHRCRHDKQAMLAALDELSGSCADVEYLTEFIRSAKEGVHGA
jgi:UDP-N-acetylglucosamine acyltransferase